MPSKCYIDRLMKDSNLCTEVMRLGLSNFYSILQIHPMIWSSFTPCFMSLFLKGVNNRYDLPYLRIPIVTFVNLFPQL